MGCALPVETAKRRPKRLFQIRFLEAGFDVNDHFLDIRKMVDPDSGTKATIAAAERGEL